MQNNTAGLRSIRELPEEYRPLFTNYPCFNRVQSSVFDNIMTSTASLVVTAPTGSGKTAMFELSLVKLLMESQDVSKVKAVYIAPVKALCNERFQDWAPRFESLGVSCAEITGDSVNQDDIRGHQVILTTPEKWDSITRRWRDNANLINMVKLVMIDEVHLLSDPKRGPTLEAIVCRMKTINASLKFKSSIRFIAVSATIVNIDDLAKWLSTDQPAEFHRFGNEMRPVTLKRVVKGFPQSKSAYLFDIQLSYKLKPIISEYSNGKPVLIFCSTRRGVVQTCKTLMSQLSFALLDEQKMPLQEMSGRLDDVKLRDFVKSGAGYHHAGLTLNDRTLIQDAFMQGWLPVLIATSTLAMGVNLPAHLVIIKSTHQYIAGRVVEYSESSILQMVGRAGRPQFDTSATAVIMTKNDLVVRYQNLLDCKEVLESSLHLQLAEHLNSEIVLHTIGDLGVAMEWLKSTFLYQRALKNPRHYGMPFTECNTTKIEKHLELMVIREFNALQRSGLVTLSDNGLDVSPTDDGRLMSFYFISFNTFKLFADVASDASMKSVLKTISEASELNETQLRVTERRILNELNVSKTKETIRFPLAGKIKTREMKIECLIQACLGCLTVSDPSLMQESLRIVMLLGRIIKCLTEYMSRKNHYCSLLSCVTLSKCLHAKLWENSTFVARQLERIGPMLGLCLVRAGKTSFTALLQTHPRELERIMNRGPPLGSNIIAQVKHLPRYSLGARIHREGVLRAQLFITVDFENREDVEEASTARGHHAVALIVGDTNNRLLLYKRLLDRSLLEKPASFFVTINPPMPQKVAVNLISEQWVGLDAREEFVINPMAVAKVRTDGYLPAIDEKIAKKAKKAEKNSEPKNVKSKESNVTKMFASFSNAKIIPEINSPAVECCFDLEPELSDLSNVDNDPCGEILDNLTNSVGQERSISPIKMEYVQPSSFSTNPQHNDRERIDCNQCFDTDDVLLDSENIANEGEDERPIPLCHKSTSLGDGMENHSMIVEKYSNQNSDSVLADVLRSPGIALAEETARPIENSYIGSTNTYHDNLSANTGVWQITQIMDPKTDGVPDLPNFDISFNLSQENDVQNVPDIHLDNNPGFSEVSPVCKKRKVTFVDKVEEFSISDHSLVDNLDLPLSGRGPEGFVDLNISPPHPVLLESSEEALNGNPNEAVEYTSRIFDDGPLKNEVFANNLLENVRRPQHFFSCEIQSIVGKVIDNKLLSGSQTPDFSQTMTSWAQLENVLSQTNIANAKVTPRHPSKKILNNSSDEIINASHRQTYNAIENVIPKTPIIEEAKCVESLKRTLSHIQPQRRLESPFFQRTTLRETQPEFFEHSEPMRSVPKFKNSQSSVNQPCLQLMSQASNLITNHFPKVGKPGYSTTTKTKSPKAADCKSLLSQLERFQMLKPTGIWYDIFPNFRLFSCLLVMALLSFVYFLNNIVVMLVSVFRR